jgi:glycosyltransferase involved in cell wall biosynthesis
MARYWARKGVEVTVLTGMPNHPSGVIHPEYQGALRRVEVKDGYRIVRTWLYATPNEGFLRKTLCHLSFMFTGFLLGWRKTGGQDVVIVSSPTFFSIATAWAISRIKRAKFVVEVRDLWPSIFVELGVLTNPTIIRILEALELAAYRAADEVVVVTRGFKRHIVDRGIDEGKVHVIPNGVDTIAFKPGGTTESDNWRKVHGFDETDVLVVYIGAHGISQKLSTVLHAAQAVQSSRVQFVLVGEGAEKAALQREAAALGLDNVTLLPAVPRDQVATILGASDICLVSLKDIPLFSTFIPSKMFEYMAVGKPVIGCVCGESADILKDAGCEVVPPESARDLAVSIDALADDPIGRERMGQAARRYVMTHFNREVLAESYRELLINTAGGSLEETNQRTHDLSL